MKILLSNDDGYSAIGLVALANSLKNMVDLKVVAPESNCSGLSNSLTLNRPLNVNIDHDDFIIVNGTPADCIHLSLTGLLEKKPDLVISGINNGANMGNDVLYSGTVAAAREAYVFGVPSMAFSLANKGWDHLDSAIKVVNVIIKSYINNNIEKKILLNINIPNVSINKINGIMITKLGKRLPSDGTIKTYNPYGEPSYWIGKVGAMLDDIEGTDFYAISRNFISITPLGIDSTATNDICLLEKWASEIII